MRGSNQNKVTAWAKDFNAMEVIESAEGDGFMSSVFDDEMDVANILASPAAGGDMERPGTPDSQPSIDFSAATPESNAGNAFNAAPLPFDDFDDGHDSFDFNGGLDLFSDGGDVDDSKSISDVSSDGETRKKPKQKKTKPTKERKPPKERAEEPEVRKVSVVETEIEVSCDPSAVPVVHRFTSESELID